MNKWMIWGETPLFLVQHPGGHMWSLWCWPRFEVMCGSRNTSDGVCREWGMQEPGGEGVEGASCARKSPSLGKFGTWAFAWNPRKMWIFGSIAANVGSSKRKILVSTTAFYGLYRLWTNIMNRFQTQLEHGSESFICDLKARALWYLHRTFSISTYLNQIKCFYDPTLTNTHLHGNSPQKLENWSIRWNPKSGTDGTQQGYARRCIVNSGCCSLSHVEFYLFQSEPFQPVDVDIGQAVFFF